MVEKSNAELFNSDWQKAVAWAQTQGISSKDYLPVYQKDAADVQAGDYPMSAAERNRSILAASNPNNVTPVPSDAPSPMSFLGNARDDLRNIFTGLAPNHLIPNIYHTALTTIMHPSSWIDPIEDVAKGVTTGNTKDIKAGLEAAGGQNSILSWIPGVYDASEFAKGGIDAVLEHPVVSFLDVAPFAPAGKVLELAASESRMASIASGLAMTPDELAEASVPKMAAKYILTRDIAKDVNGTMQARFPGIGALTKTLVDKDGKPLTVSGAFQKWGLSHNGLSKALSFVAASAFDLRSYGTDAEMYTMIPLQDARKKLTNPDDQKMLTSLVDKTDPRTQSKTTADVMADQSIPQDVRDAYDKYQDVIDMGESQAGAAGGMVSIQGPDITTSDGKVMRYTDWFSVTQQASTVVSAARDSRHDLMNLVKAMGPAHKITQEVDQLDAQFSDYAKQTEIARKDALKAPTAGNTPERDLTDERGRVIKKVALPLARQRDLLMADDGLISKALEAGSKFSEDNTPKDADFETMAALLKAAKRDLTRNGFGRLDTSVNPAFAEVARRVDVLIKYADKRIERERSFLKELSGDVPKYKRITKGEMEATTRVKRETRLAHNEARSVILKALKKAEASYRRFTNEWWANAADSWRPVLYDAMIEKVLDSEDKVYRTEQMVDKWRELKYTDTEIDKMRSDPKVLAEAIWHESKMAASNPGGRAILSEEDMENIYYDAVDHVNQLRAEGHQVQYVPVLTSLDVAQRDPGRYGVQLSDKGAPKVLSSTKARKMADFMPERYDLLASVHQSVKEAIERNITIEFANTHLAPHAMTAGEVSDWVQKAFHSEFAGRDVKFQNLPDAVAEKVARRLGLKKWDPMGRMGFSFPRWGDDAIYLPAGLADATDKLLGADKKFPLEGAYDALTNTFRFSILALSPRYTAHIVFGGAFLLALRSDPRIVTKFAQAYKIAKEGTIELRLRGSATEIGKASLEYPSFVGKTPVDAALTAVSTAAGSDLGKLHIQEILGKQGILWSKASPLQWIKAAGEANYRFTNRVSTMYRAAAYLDASSKAMRDGFHDPVTGEKVAMTADRAKDIGVQHALKVMGDLKAMTPFERATFMRIMPFYGWTKHILNYVLTYPADHPYRAQFLTVLADQDSDSVSKALDTRILFTYFLGNPTSDGSVSGIDVRFLDPLRDVGNYASLSGWIQALNPVIEAPLAMIDPNLIYGSTSLYPNVTYDQFYGIETTTNPTAGLNALEQVIPQTGALATAFNLAGSARNLATTNPNEFAKTIFESLNIPFAQVQHLNVKQIAAKGEEARYRVASTAASNAWQTPGMQGTGIEQALQGYSSVPNPLNPDYEITPAQLQQIYNEAIVSYPGQNPSEVVSAPPSPAGY